MFEFKVRNSPQRWQKKLKIEDKFEESWYTWGWSSKADKRAAKEVRDGVEKRQVWSKVI